MLIAPTERPPISNLGKCSSVPEQFGVDILWWTNGQSVGVQRKEVNDLIASVHDGRLARELAMMKRLSVKVLVVEGKMTWTLDGELITKGFGKPWTRSQHRGLLWSVRSKGIWVEWTDDARDTCVMVEQLESWIGKEKHQSTERRPGPETVWGQLTNRDYACHLLMGLPGVGVELAGRIVDKFGGVPWQWTVTKEELMTVEGVGKKKAEAMLKVLSRDEGPSTR